MMKLSKLTLLLLILLSGFVFVACSNQTTTVSTEATVPATKITISGVGIINKTLTMVIGDEIALNATVSPSDATNKSIEWSSADSEVVSVSATGVLNALKEGNVTVEATNGEISETLTIIVVGEVTLTSIAFDSEAVSVNIGNQKQLNVIYNPSNATNISLFYSIAPIGDADSSLVSVSATGLVTVKSNAVPDSQYLVTAMVVTDTSIYAQCTITVNEIQLTALSLKKNNEAVAINTSESNRLLVPINLISDVLAFVPIYTPSNTTQIDVTYTSSDTSVMTINEYGVYSVSSTATVGDEVEITVTGSGNVSYTVYVEISESVSYVYQLFSAEYFDNLAVDYRAEWDIEQYGTDGITADISDDYYDTAGNKPTTQALWRGGKTIYTYGGVAPWDGVWGVIFDSWDHPYNDDEVANQYMFNKISIGTDMNVLKMRVRSHITQTTSERGKFRVGVITTDTLGNYNSPVYLDLLQGVATEGSDSWLVISNSTVADYEAGNDYFYFDVSSYIGQDVIIVFEVDDMHDDGLEPGEMDSVLCDRIAWLGAWLQVDTSEED